MTRFITGTENWNRRKFGGGFLLDFRPIYRRK